jgi:sugar diacid utilization regulator
MEKKDLIPGGNAIRYLEKAALYPQRRGEMIVRALHELLVYLPALGVALVWPCQDRKVPWKVYYAGTRRESVQRWLTARLDFSLDATLGVLQQDLSKLPDMPIPRITCLQPAPKFPAGLWIIWPSISPLSHEAHVNLDEIRRMLEALIELEISEEYYFSSMSPLSDPALIEALGRGDPHALSQLLSLTRLVGRAEVTAWGRAYQNEVETTDHVGARQSGFGFVVPYGHGLGGHIIASGKSIPPVDDYRNSPYRDRSVSDIVDSEQLRSVIALPVRSRIGQERSEYVAGVLYAARRTVKPFSLAEQLLVQRLTHLLEPLPPLTRPTTFLPIFKQKVVWYKLVRDANRIESLEIWIGQLIKGTIIVTDNDGHPYVPAHREQLERLRDSYDNSRDGVQVIPLGAPDVSLSGQVYLRSAIALPPPDWPDFFADLAVGCNMFIERVEKAHDHLARQREQWLQDVLQEKPLPQISQEGYRLGLPIENGQLWVIAWPSQCMLTRQSTRKRMQVENVVLDQLKCPLLFLGDDIGVILLNTHVEPQPSKLRDALLTYFAYHPLWIVYGSRYRSPHDLKMVLTHSISLAQNARREVYSEYLLDARTPKLSSLLANPKVANELYEFATKLLAPLLEHDRSKGTDFTTTFVLMQALGSTQAVSEELGVSVDAVRYRLRRVDEILGVGEASHDERVTWGLAALVWKRLHPFEQNAP